MSSEAQKDSKNNFSELFRYVTPLVLIVLTSICTLANGKLSEIDTKLFTHLTNHEMHTPREQLVSKAEFELQNKMSEERFKDMVTTQRIIITSIDTLQKDVNNLSICLAQVGKRGEK